MRLLSILFSIVCISLFSSCTRTIIGSHTLYTDAELKGATLVIMPVSPKDITLDNAKHLAESVPALAYDDKENFVASNLTSELLSQFRYHFQDSPNNITIRRGFPLSDTVKTKTFHNRSGITSKERSTIEFEIPLHYPTEEIPKVDFLLLVNEISFGSQTYVKTNYYSQNGMISPYSSTHNDHEMDIIFNYIIWDFRKDEPASYGIAHSYTEVMSDYTYEDWQALFSELPDHILDNTQIR